MNVNVSNRIARMVCWALAISLLVACGKTGPGEPFAPTAPQIQNSVLRARLGVWPESRQYGPSKTAPNAKKQRKLLYIVDLATSVANIYSYPKGAIKGTLAGFALPSTLCVEGSDVWLANTNASQLLEYAFGGTKPVDVITTSGQYPFGCAYDARTGSLAVSNVSATNLSDISVWIYKKGSPKPKKYSLARTHIVDDPYVGYDDKSDLFVDGQDAGKGFRLAELDKGAKRFAPVAAPGLASIFPGSVQWDSREMAVGDQGTGALSGSNMHSEIYQLSIKSHTASIAGHTPLDDAGDCLQYFIEAGTVVVPNFVSVSGSEQTVATIQFYRYPSGGKPTKKISVDGLPVGAAVVSR